MTLMLIGAACWFTLRGPVRATGNSQDLTMIYAAAAAWVDGDNPYLFDTLAQVAVDQQITFEQPTPETFHALYPPTTYLLMAPLSVFPWTTARALWLGINILATVLLVGGLVRFATADRSPRWALGMATLALLCAPFHTAIANGQTPIVAVTLALYGLWWQGKGRWLLGGTLIGLAIVFKTQIVGFLIFWMIARRAWKLLATTLGTCAVLGGVAAARLQLNHPDWWSNWSANINDFTGPGSVGDPTDQNPFAYQLINLHYPLNTILSNPSLVGTLITVATLAVVAVAVGLAWRRTHRNADLLLAAVLLVVSLMAGYHRAYDAVLVLVPLAWAIRDRGASVWLRGVVAVAVVAFVPPWSGTLYQLQASGRVPASLADSFIWQSVIQPMQAWMVPVLVVALLLALRGANGSEDAVAPAKAPINTD